jgi:TPR repeat protein
VLHQGRIVAVDGGSMNGCFNLGVMYSDGEGVKQDYFKANEFYKK